VSDEAARDAAAVPRGAGSRRLARRVLATVLLAVLLYGAFVSWTGWREMGALWGRFRAWTFVAALGLSTFNYALRFLKWEYYLGRLEIGGIGRGDSALVFLSGFVLTVTPGKLGEVFKSAVLSETHGVPAARTAPIVVAERLTDVIAVVVLIALGGAAFPGGLPWAAAGACAAGLGIVAVLWRRPGDAVVGWLERGPARLRRLAPRAREAWDSLRVVAAPGALLWPTALSLFAWAAEGVGLWLLVGGFGAATPLGLTVFFYATATLAGALIPVPGGLGVVETMIREQLVRLGGAPEAEATAAMILIRFATLWWAVLVGFAALGVLRARHPRLGAG
jgi:uncharacterized membrane protein YbhN (UPF0104 family)